MHRYTNKQGSVLLMVVFLVALLAALVMGMLELNTEELQLMQNHVYAAEAQATAEAGLQDALAQLRANAAWTAGFTGKSFNGGSYTVTVNGLTVQSVGTSARGYTSRVAADLTVVGTAAPFTVRVNALRING